jgi:hypothetical protein
MKSTVLARHESTFPTGMVTVSLIRVTLSDQATYYEVAVLDTRPLDLRKHRRSIIETYARESRAREVYGVVVDAATLGHVVFGVDDAELVAS